MAKSSLSTHVPAPHHRTARARNPRVEPLAESLECRRLCSVTVTQGWTGYYHIQGTPAADTINVSVSRSAGTFTFGGTTYTGVQYISIAGNGGNDSISVEGSGTGSVGASIDGGDGNDTISLNFDGGIWGGNGNDSVNLSDSFRGAAVGDAGDDFITIRGNCIDVEIYGGEGDDGIDASNNNYGVVADGGPGDDGIIGTAYDDELHGGTGIDYIFGEGGNDVIYVSDSGAEDWVLGGAGYDTMYGDFSDVIGDASVEVIHRG